MSVYCLEIDNVNLSSSSSSLINQQTNFNEKSLSSKLNQANRIQLSVVSSSSWMSNYDKHTHTL